MSRLQKKCLIASAGMHALLCVILLVGPAFLPQHKVEPAPQIIEIVGEPKVTDGPTQGGGNPQVAPLQEPPPAAPSPTPPERPQEEIRVPEQKPQPEPAPKPEEPKQVNKEAEIPDVKQPKHTVKPTLNPVQPKTPVADKKPSNDKPKVSLKQVERPKSTQVASQKTASQKQSDAFREIARNVNRAKGDILNKTGSATRVQISGGGEGVDAVNYQHLVKFSYDRAWPDPMDVADENANVKVEITIERSGNVINTRILNRSGIPALDKSVQRALDGVKFIAPFPEDSTDKQRTFILNFNLKAKRMTG